MEVAAGFAEHVDVQVGRVIDEVDRLGCGENTLVFYIWGDNGSSGEGQAGTISELLAQNGIPTHRRQHITALEEMGGLDVLGTPKVDNQYHAGVGLGGQHALQGHEAAGLRSRRHAQPAGGPLAGRVSRPDATPRSQFHHCNDVVPTIYEIVGITPPRVVNGDPAGPDRRRQLRVRVRRRRRSRAAARPSTSRSWAAARSTTTAGWLRPSARGCRGSPACRPASRTGRRTTTCGTVQPRRRLDASQRPRGADAREGRADEGDSSRSRRPATASTRSAAAYGSRSITPSCGSRRRTASGTSAATSSGCPSSARRRSGNRANLVTIDADIPRERQRRAVRAGELERRPHRVPRRRVPLLRVQPVHHHADQDPLRGARPGGPGEDRDLDRVRRDPSPEGR